MSDLDPNAGDLPADPVVTDEPEDRGGDPAKKPDPKNGEGDDGGADPPDWRAQWAGEDKDLLKFLGRFHSPDAAIKRFKTINDDLKGGKYLKPLPDAPSDEELAAWRKDNGIPEAAEGYYESLAEGLVVGEDDKPFVDKFMAEMHGANASPAVVNAALDAYYGIVEEQAAAEVEFSKEVEQASIEELREEWGAEYKRNLNIMNGYLGKMPEGVQAIFKHGRVPEFDEKGEPTGRMIPIGYKAEAIRWLVAQALEENPVATVVPGAGANQAAAIADELAEIRKVMREDRARYNKDEKMQARYRELIGAEQKLKGD